MMILAWAAVMVPAILAVGIILWLLTGGFKDWEELIGIAIGIAMLVSFIWGCEYIAHHKHSGGGAKVQAEESK